MVNLVGMTSFREVSDDLKMRLPDWIFKIEGGHTPEILDAKSRFPRQYRLKAGDLSPNFPPVFGRVLGF
jgi:hypothetical protein